MRNAPEDFNERCHWGKVGIHERIILKRHFKVKTGRKSRESKYIFEDACLLGCSAV
jgi:hypothetical protein